MDRRIVKTKRAIQDAYFAMITEAPEQRITVTDIARRADVDRKTFYLHYSSPEDILEQFCDERIRLLLKELEATGFLQDPLRVELIFNALNKLVEMDIGLYRSLAWDIHYQSFWDRVERIMSDTVVRVYGPMVSVPPEELKLYTDFFASGLVTIYLNWLKSEGEVPLEKLAEIVTRLADRGIMSLFPGHHSGS